MIRSSITQSFVTGRRGFSSNSQADALAASMGNLSFEETGDDDGFDYGKNIDSRCTRVSTVVSRSRLAWLGVIWRLVGSGSAIQGETPRARIS